MRISRMLAGTLVAAVLVTGPAACGSKSGSSSQATTINLSTAVPIDEVANYLIEYVAIHHGYFAKQGLTVHLTQFSGGGAEETALASGQEDIILLSPTGAAEGIKKGVQQTIIAVDGQGAGTFELIVPASSPVRSPQQLHSGSTVAVSSTGSSTYYYALFLKKRYGVSVKPVPLGVPGYLQSTEAGKVDAAVADEPQDATALAKHKVRVIASYGQILPQGGGATDTIIVGNNFLSAHREAVTHFMHAWDQALAWFTTNRASAIALIKQEESVNGSTAKYLYQRDILTIHPKGAFTNAEIATSISLSGISIKTLPPIESFVSHAFS